MDGPLAIASRVIHYYVALPLHLVHTLLLPRRRQYVLFVLAFFAILVIQNLFSGLLPMPFSRGEMFARALQAASNQSAAACQELLVNGNLETSGGWRFGATPAPGTIVDAPVHGGAFAIRLGIAGANTVAYSTAYQTIALPADAEQIVLTYWEQPGATGDSGDYREVIALHTDFTVLRSLVRQTGAGDEQWTQRTFDLTDLRGQSIILYLNVYNNGSGATLVNYWDDIALQSCDSTTPTATPTMTSTPTPTATPTTPNTPAPPTPTATATPLPSNIVLIAGSVTVAEGQSSVTAPLDLLGASAERAVGVLSVDVLYNAVALKVNACAVDDSFDLLLCNTATPGVLRLAGLMATGISTATHIADLRFELLDPASLPTQLTVQLTTVADMDGTALSASGQHGQIILACTPGSADCQVLFLPLVSR